MKQITKTMIALLAVAAMLLSFAACGNKPVKDEENGQNPVMNFVGTYAADRCTIIVTASGDSDAAITVDWANSASENSHWTMSGLFDADTQRVNYMNGTKTVSTYDSNGNVTEEKTEYTDGAGRIQFYDDGTLQWQDEQEADRLIGMTFKLIPTEGDAALSEGTTQNTENETTTEDSTTTETTTEKKDSDESTSVQSASPEQESGRTLADYVGDYAAGRCTITVEAVSEKDAKISVLWGQSASEGFEYTMTGAFDPDTFRINYADSEKKNVVYGDDGSVTEEKIEYSDGVGRIQFFGDGTLQWQDEQEADQLVGVTFTLVPSN